MNDSATPSADLLVAQLQRELESSRALNVTLESKLKAFESIIDELNELKNENEKLKEQIGKSSRNSSKSPSSDSDSQKEKRREKRRRKSTGRSQGAQPGHEKHERAVLPEDVVDYVERYWPPRTCACQGTIEIDPEPKYRHQVFDLPEVLYTVTEHQVYSGQCTCCHQKHVGAFPRSVPSGQMGPGLIAWIAMMSGQFHLSIRKIQALLKEQWELEFSTGAICQSQAKFTPCLDPHYADIAEYTRDQAVAHADETSHYSEGKKAWMWVLAVTGAVLFIAHYSRGKKAAEQLLGSFNGYLVTDQFVGYTVYDTFKRQLCWAHLVRKFTAMSERCGQGGEIGRRLLLYSQMVFRIRHYFEQNRIDEAVYKRRIWRVQVLFEQTVEDGAHLDGDNSRTVNQCRYLLPELHMCWTFMQDHRIPLTNNFAERQLRPYVIWRKLSHGAQSLIGNQFRSQVLSVVHTLREQNIPVYKFLRQSSEEYVQSGKVTTRINFCKKIPLQAP